MPFQAIDPSALRLSPFEAIGKDWMLITAGDRLGINTMTASWGGMGVLWGDNVVTVYIRPQRYTFDFVQANPRFSLCFFDGFRQELNLLGTVSGRDRDKIAEAGLTPLFLDDTPAFQEARLILTAEKVYRAPFDPACFVDPSLDGRVYPTGDYHVQFIGRVLGVYQRED